MENGRLFTPLGKINQQHWKKRWPINDVGKQSRNTQVKPYKRYKKMKKNEQKQNPSISELVEMLSNRQNVEEEQHRKVYFDEKMNHMFYVDFDSLPQY